MPIICLMVRENHKMVREMSGKSQGILWGLMAGHPVNLSFCICVHVHASWSNGISYYPKGIHTVNMAKKNASWWHCSEARVCHNTNRMATVNYGPSLLFLCKHLILHNDFNSFLLHYVCHALYFVLQAICWLIKWFAFRMDNLTLMQILLQHTRRNWPWSKPMMVCYNRVFWIRWVVILGHKLFSI